MRAALAILAILVAATPALARTRMTDADVRAFAARQQAAWNDGQLDRYFAGFTPDATFTDQAYVGGKPPVPYGTSTLAKARTLAARAKGRSREAVEVLRVQVAADGRTAEVQSRVGSTVETAGKVRRLCASREQTLVLADGRLRASRQVDTFVKCRAG